MCKQLQTTLPHRCQCSYCRAELQTTRTTFLYYTRYRAACRKGGKKSLRLNGMLGNGLAAELLLWAALCCQTSMLIPGLQQTGQQDVKYTFVWKKKEKKKGGLSAVSARSDCRPRNRLYVFWNEPLSLQLCQALFNVGGGGEEKKWRKGSGRNRLCAASRRCLGTPFMFALCWIKDLAFRSQTRAFNCKLGHSPARVQAV